jgi:hypothetical protein
MTSSPWARAGSPSVTLPPPPAPPPTPTATVPPAVAPYPNGFPQGPKPRRRVWPWVTLGLLLAVVISAATASIVTFAAVHNAAAQPSSAPSASTSAPTTPQFSAADSSAAKDHLCQVFDVSVRGQEGQGGLRVQGNLNLPIVLRGVNSVSAVQNALTPAVPPEIAAAARKYISATLDQTTAAMGNTPTPEVNRLTDVRNDATYALSDACGIPR